MNQVRVKIDTSKAKTQPGAPGIYVDQAYYRNGEIYAVAEDKAKKHPYMVILSGQDAEFPVSMEERVAKLEKENAALKASLEGEPKGKGSTKKDEEDGK